MWNPSSVIDSKYLQSVNFELSDRQTEQEISQRESIFKSNISN